MTTVKSDSHLQSGHVKPTDSQIVPAEIVRSMIRKVGTYRVEEARILLNLRFKGKFSDIVHEARKE